MVLNLLIRTTNLQTAHSNLIRPYPIKTVDTKNLELVEIYKLLIGAIVPRPIAFVSTRSKSGITNVAPYSFFNGVSSNPPCLMFSVTRKPDGSKKNTLSNIEATKEFVVNIAGANLAEKVNLSAYPYGENESEFKKVGLTEVNSENINTPRVLEAPIQMECKLYKTLEIGSGDVGSSVIVVGEIIKLHFKDEVYKDGKIVLEKLNPLARLAGRNYAKGFEVFELERPKKID